jgi:hypothetical protein
MAAAMYMAAVEAGAGCVDCSISTLSSFSSQPPVESMKTILESEGFDTGLDAEALAKINAYFMDLKKKRQPASSASVEAVDAGVLVHAIPGGMISNLRSQLAQTRLGYAHQILLPLRQNGNGRFPIGAIGKQGRRVFQNGIPHLQLQALILLAVRIGKHVKADHGLIDLCLSVDRKQADEQKQAADRKCNGK